ncbi:hypothetical protein [Paenibacillus eucommiae]|uniref:Acetyl-CoA acetyltransferase n=1 Tax=Paenibacillus eucommiae TaxID=1355755 RepID=A0ABS4J9I7_9BACL|nr:hypothetical protein [Paenibacillus eucommiae]MBP1996523.1 hypothetical protein [Paenibacillus eucommiae]
MNMSSMAQPTLTPIYQCHSEVHQLLCSVKDHLHQLCGQHANRLVKVETMDGEVFEGHIVHCDKSILYLSLSNEGYSRAFFPGYPNPYVNSNVVLPLVLFNLLAISLL